MLTVFDGSKTLVLDNDTYYIKQKWSGLDELLFDLSIYDPNYPLIAEEAYIYESHTEGDTAQRYVIKAIDGATDSATIRAVIDNDDFKAQMLINYSNGSATLQNTLTPLLPAGWMLVAPSTITARRTIAFEDGVTPWDVVEACRDTYGVTFRLDNAVKVLTAIDPEAYSPLGAFASRDLNLKEINYKGKSTDLFTRLYAYGKDGLSFADINDGKPYVDNFSYTDKIICKYWQDERYTVAENLLAAAQSAVNTGGVPERSYACSVVDLAKTNPDKYAFEDFSLFQVVTLVDDTRNTAVNHQVVEYWIYPFYPENNVVTLSTVAPKIQNSIKSLQTEISNPNSEFRTQLKTAINNATDWITGNNGGYVVFHRNAQGQPDEILIMDTPDVATAQKVWRWNSGGLGYSSTGYNGPYETAMTQDGAIVANFITTGTLTANLIKSGTLESLNGALSFDVDTGMFASTDSASNAALQIDGANIFFRKNGGVIGQVSTVYNNAQEVIGIAFSGSNGKTAHVVGDGGTLVGNNYAPTQIIGSTVSILGQSVAWYTDSSGRTYLVAQ